MGQLFRMQQYSSHPPPYPGETHQMVYKAQPPPQPMEKVPVFRVCPTCKNEGLTIVTPSIKLTGWLLILILGVCGLIACCQDGWKEFKHRCSYCGFQFGSYEPSLNTNEKLSLAAAVCCLVFLPILIIVIYFGVFLAVLKNENFTVFTSD